MGPEHLRTGSFPPSFLLTRENELKRGSFSGFALNRYLPAVGMDDFPGYGQPEPQTFFLGGVLKSKIR